MRVSRRYVITGRVQGVGFRFFTEQVAACEGIYGWVRNAPDGRVEVEAEGETEAMLRFELRLRHGPPGARVDAVDTTDEPPSYRHGGFEIR